MPPLARRNSSKKYAYLRRVTKGVPSYTEVAVRLGITESAVKSAAHRMRQRFRELVRAEVAQTVADPKDVDEEIRHLLSVIGAA